MAGVRARQERVRAEEEEADAVLGGEAQPQVVRAAVGIDHDDPVDGRESPVGARDGRDEAAELGQLAVEGRPYWSWLEGVAGRFRSTRLGRKSVLRATSAARNVVP